MIKNKGETIEEDVNGPATILANNDREGKMRLWKPKSVQQGCNNAKTEDGRSSGIGTKIIIAVIR